MSVIKCRICSGDHLTIKHGRSDSRAGVSAWSEGSSDPGTHTKTENNGQDHQTKMRSNHEPAKGQVHGGRPRVSPHSTPSPKCGWSAGEKTVILDAWDDVPVSSCRSPASGWDKSSAFSSTSSTKDGGAVGEKAQGLSTRDKHGRILSLNPLGQTFPTGTGAHVKDPLELQSRVYCSKDSDGRIISLKPLNARAKDGNLLLPEVKLGLDADVEVETEVDIEVDLEINVDVIHEAH